MGNSALVDYGETKVMTPAVNVTAFVHRDHLARAIAAFPIIFSSLTLGFCSLAAFGLMDKHGPEMTSHKDAGLVCSAISGGVLLGSIGVALWDPTTERDLEK